MTGYTLGSGLELALGCHWRLATKNAKIGMSEISMGLIPSKSFYIIILFIHSFIYHRWWWNSKTSKSCWI